MIVTRGSHLLTSITLPDASFALFLIGGMLLTNPKWFISLFTVSVLIDLITLSINPTDQIPINLGYLGLLPSYGVMWLVGLYISKVNSILKFATFSALGTFVSFMISTQTYYLLSNKFPGITIQESIHAGWEYLPLSFCFTMSYLISYWAIRHFIKEQFNSQKVSKTQVL
ncbi:MAG: hypothetical protein EXR41_00205 [Candidatus Methylopumilus sp.]|nr:hypothetical protein [Candidatus Methylopumilus sp.]